jgi:hypothetical protein
MKGDAQHTRIDRPAYIYCDFGVLSLVVVPSAQFFATYFAMSLPGHAIVLPSVRHGFSVNSLALATCSWASTCPACVFGADFFAASFVLSLPGCEIAFVPGRDGLVV